jgi:UDP-glucose 4-epimerase
MGVEDSIRQLHVGLKRMSFADPDFRVSQLVRLKVLSRLQQEGRLNDQVEWVTPPSQERQPSTEVA